jgi:hypothetical protein
LTQEFETVSETLIAKQQLLTALEQSEYESQRLTAILSDEGGVPAAQKSFMDSDPTMSRRNKISQMKDVIIGLEAQREQMRVGLLEANDRIQADLDNFQRGKIEDFRKVMQTVAEGFKEYHVKMAAGWRKSRELIA